MPTTFPWPRTEAEVVDHLHTQHGIFVRSLAEWRELFGEMRGPIRVHEQMHSYATRRRHQHQHSTIGVG